MKHFLHKARNYRSAEGVDVFDELTLWSARFAQPLLEYFPLQAGLRVLDVGCGTGFPAFELAQMLGADAEVVAIDTWEEGILLARRKAGFHGLEHLTFRVADGACMPFESDSFDVVVSHLGLNNFKDPEAVLSECARVLRPGGQILLTTNFQGHMREFYVLYDWLLEKQHLDRCREALQAEAKHRITPEALHDLLWWVGFRVTRKESHRFTMRFLNGEAFFRHALIGHMIPGWAGLLPEDLQPAIWRELEKEISALALLRGHWSVTIPWGFFKGIKNAWTEKDGFD